MSHLICKCVLPWKLETNSVLCDLEINPHTICQTVLQKKKQQKGDWIYQKKLRNLSEEIEKLTPERWGRPTLD